MNYATSAEPTAAVSFTPSATTWIKLSVIYLIAGVSLGIAMGATQNFTLRPVRT